LEEVVVVLISLQWQGLGVFDCLFQHLMTPCIA
jgi:hypothetical protein